MSQFRIPTRRKAIKKSSGLREAYYQENSNSTWELFSKTFQIFVFLGHLETSLFSYLGSVK